MMPTEYVVQPFTWTKIPGFGEVYHNGDRTRIVKVLQDSITFADGGRWQFRSGSFEEHAEQTLTMVSF